MSYLKEDININEIKSVQLCWDSYPQIITGSLEALIDYTSLSLDTLTVLILKNDMCICYDLEHPSLKEVNMLATNIYRTYSYRYSYSEVIYGNALLLGYNNDYTTQNKERFNSLPITYINEIINRFNSL
jgi:hypothetical protein